MAKTETLQTKLSSMIGKTQVEVRQTIKINSDSRNKLIPPNDPKAPRWLFDLHDWKLERYIDIARTIETGGHVIVSYTWGYIADLQKPQPDDKLPRGLLWDVPTTSGFSLDQARERLCPKLALVMFCGIGWREEIGKNIYCNAKKSIVWLHSTDWSLQSPLKTLLLAGSKDNGTLTTEPKAYLIKLFWGWTLQEGVLPPETILIDGASNALEHDTFMHNGGQASVIDLTARVGILVDESVHMANEFLQILRALVTSVFVAYGKASPLFILSGKQSRKFCMQQDSCWALIGAMELEDAAVDYKLPMDEIKRILLIALFEKYQSSMLLLPQPSFSVNKRQSTSGFKLINIMNGVLIPVGLFVDSQIGLASQSMLPRISLDNAKTVTVQPPRTSQTFTLWKNLGIKWYLHYVQAEAGVEIRSPASKTNPTPRISDAVF
ncbi:hypothetical protein BTUL_0019g00480 [Botrytis tulipae]|uniref:Heterokaryon incompatibility domain-containing protein n=1 Tax=Botrytis tulipae TaxID=87230 RepID=A0A4Z1F168_9HELO|nr:hypothetical protein BTUL_0019g00480 [Botrytis tulipae]